MFEFRRYYVQKNTVNMKPNSASTEIINSEERNLTTKNVTNLSNFSLR